MARRVTATAVRFDVGGRLLLHRPRLSLRGRALLLLRSLLLALSLLRALLPSGQRGCWRHRGLLLLLLRRGGALSTSAPLLRIRASFRRLLIRCDGSLPSAGAI
jgi:hypothetical protein